MTNYQLKWIALITMTVDHLGVLLFETDSYMNLLFRLIGRLSFPIFAFLITEGYFNTKNIKRYVVRLSIFAIISEIPFDLFFFDKIIFMNKQNVFFTLLLGLFAIMIFEYIINKNNKLKPIALVSVLCIAVIAYITRTDYNMFGVLMIFVFYYFRDNKEEMKFYFMYIIFLMVLAYWSEDKFRLNPYDFIQITAPFALYLIYKYNGERGRSLKYVFYLYYPCHIILLYIVKIKCL